MRIIALLLALPLAACGGGASTPAPAPTATPGYSATQRQVIALPDEQLRGVFIRAVRDARIDCQGVTKAERRDDLAKNGEPTWIATCQDGATYAISITPDGTALIVGSGTVGRRG